MEQKTLVVNFSGGRSSGVMVAEVLQNPIYGRYRKIFIFCNTGCEHENTLKFVHQCQQHFNIDLVWLECVTNPVPGVGARHKIVTYESASRAGEPFAAMVAKYGLPNMATPHCTRELKTATTISYLRSLGLKNADIVMAMGYRDDEPQRHKSDRVIDELYPLVLIGADKTDVNLWWDAMPFNLELEEHQGNCTFCWKKSDAKHFLNIAENPQFYDFPERMDQLHAKTALKPVERKRTMFRDYRPTKVLKAQADLVAMNPDDLRRMIHLEHGGDCSEECHAMY